MQLSSSGGAIGERIMLPMPLAGAVLRRSLAARWCDTAQIAVSAGLDLPAAIELAGEASGSRLLQADSRLLIELLGQGVPLSSASTRLLPRSVPTAIEFASAHNDLATVLRTLAEMYQRQAELRAGAIPAILTPLLLIFIAIAVGFVLVGLLLPLVQLISGKGNFKL
jgi:type II secretory pathway component PulF